MNTIRAAVLVGALGAMCLAQESRTNNQALAELVGKADKVIAASMADSVAAAKEADAVFAAANRLFKEGMLERSESYFVKVVDQPVRSPAPGRRTRTRGLAVVVPA